MPKLRRLALLTGLSFAVAACATVLEGTTQDITVTTAPEGAACVLERDGEVIAAVEATPEVVSVSKDNRPIKVTCGKDGYLDTSRTMLAGFEDFSVGNLLFGGMIGVVVDAESGAINEYPAEIDMLMPPDGFPNAAERDAFFDILEADSQFRAQQALEAANTSALCRKNPEGQDCVALINEIGSGREREKFLIEDQRRSAQITG